jgi:hypothetical protein
MRRKTGFAACSLLGALILGACAGDDAQSLGPVPTAPSTTAVPTTTPAPVTTTSTSRAPATTSTTLKTVLVDGIPQATVTPSRAEVGTVVRIEGSGFTDASWQSGEEPLWLSGGSPGCSLYAEAQHTITVSASGRLTGTFTVPAMGGCRMSDLPPRPVPGGTYAVVFSCTVCVIGRFEVVGPGACADVAFAPNSDNLATAVIATGVSCADAEALVRKVGAQVRSVGGPSRVEVDGYVCLRTGENTAPGLPASDFECTSGSRKITFRRL